jgi:hypothetical protein
MIPKQKTVPPEHNFFTKISINERKRYLAKVEGKKRGEWMDYLLPPSSLTLFPNRMWRPAKIPLCARPITTLLLGSISFIDSITPLGSSLLPTCRNTFLYISRALNDISLFVGWFGFCFPTRFLHGSWRWR